MSDNTKLTDVVMPQLAESLVSATIGKWLKQPGDRVEEYEPICDLITDKVNAELPSTVEGTLVELLAEEGQVISVGEVIARIAVAAPAAAAAGGSAPAASTAPQAAAAAPAPGTPAAPVRPAALAPSAADAPMRSATHPRCRRLQRSTALT